MAHDLIMSPSLYVEASKCFRKGLIGSDRFIGNIHTVYGRAYESGCKILIEHLFDYKMGRGDIYTHFEKAYEYPESAEQAREYITGLAFMEGSRYLIAFDTKQHKEKNIFTLALGLQETYSWLEVFLDNNKVEEYEERIIFKGPNFVIGGAYDFIASDKHKGVSSIYDFKGITSLWNYSFPSSPQIPIYAVLKQMSEIARGTDKLISLNGGYLINMTSAKKEDDPFLYIPVNTKLVLANLENMMADFILKAKQLYKLQQENSTVVGRYMNATVGLNHCTANFNCYHLSECENYNFVTQTNPDDRVFDRLTQYDFSDSLMKTAIKKIRDNSSITNLVDGDGIISSDVFEAGVLEEFLPDASTEIDFGEV